MAITVREINEKQFALVKNGTGYNPDEVDDFLDALAGQMEALVRENVAYKQSVAAANAEIESLRSEKEALAAEKEALLAEKQEVAAEAAEKPAEPVDNPPMVREEASAPTFNEPSYFKNLETTLRETLISAQRIADETIDDARKKARKIIAEAEEQAENINDQSSTKMAEAKADYDSLKNAFEEYRRNFSILVDGQAKLLKDSPLFS